MFSSEPLSLKNFKEQQEVTENLIYKPGQKAEQKFNRVISDGGFVFTNRYYWDKITTGLEINLIFTFYGPQSFSSCTTMYLFLSGHTNLSAIN